MDDLSFNQASEEVIELATTFVEKYADYVENLPFDLQRNATRLREIDCTCREIVTEIETLCASFTNDSDINSKRKTTLIKIQRLFGRCQELGDEKISIVQQISESIENKKRIVELASNRFKSVYRPDKKNEFDGKRELNKPDCHKASKRSRRRPNFTDRTHEKEKVLHMKTEPSSAHTNTNSSFGNSNSSSEKQNATSYMDTSNNALENISKVKEEVSSNRKNEKSEKKDQSPTSSTSNGNAGSMVTSPSLLSLRTSASSSSSSSSSSKMTQAKNSTSTKTGTNTQSTNGSSKSSVKGKKKKKKSLKYHNDRAATRSPSPPMDIPIDPDEPTYCLCDQVSFGQMIGCDNKKCPIEWFHFSCVGLSHKPKGKWYCPDCMRDMKDRRKENKRDNR